MARQELSFQQIKNLLKDDLDNPFILMETIGKSVMDEDIECIVISENPNKYGIAYCQNQFKEMTAALGHGLDKGMNKERKIPIIINASIHGNEPVGAQVVLELLNYFKMNDNPKAKEILKHFIFICVVMANPDGLKKRTRCNENGFDLNRDFIFQTQPETKAIVKLIKSCNPVVLFDLHGYVSKFQEKIGLIEPCTQPHNPNYEYDLYIKWALQMALEMESSLLQYRKSFSSKRFQNMKGICIPFRDLSSGWDHYAPISTADFAILHGAIGCTIEAPSRDSDSIPWMLQAILGACQFLMDKKGEILSDYQLFFQRGIHHSHPNHARDFFPSSYILTESKSDPDRVKRLVNHLIDNGVEVELTVEDVTVESRLVPKGAFLVRMQQAKAVLANTFLGKGEKDIKEKISDSVWSLPLLWGVECIPIFTSVLLKTKTISKTDLIVQGPSPSHNKRIGIIYDGGLFRKQSHAGLKSSLLQLGFMVKEIHPRSLATIKTLNDIDVLVYNGFEHLFYTKEKVRPAYQKYVLETKNEQWKCKKTLEYFLANGGKFIAIGSGPAKITKGVFNLTNCTVNTMRGTNNAIVQVDYQEHPITEGYSAKDIGLVYRPVWFSNTENVEVIASFSSDNDSLIAGSWPDFEQAKGFPVIIREKKHDVILIGLEICHRAQPEYLFNLLVNAIHAQ